MAGPRGRDRHAAPSPPRPSQGVARGPEGPPHSPPPPLPLRPQSGRRRTEEPAAPHPPGRGRCPWGAGAPRPRQAPTRPACCRPTADRRRPGRRKRSGLIRGRPGEDRGANQGGGVPAPSPPPPPPAALTLWRLTGPRPTPAAARQPPRHEYTPGGHAGGSGRQADARRGGGAGGRPPHPPPPAPPPAREPQERPSAPLEPRGRPPPPDLVGPNFGHHKARVQAVGWSPLGTRKQGSRPFAAPPPPNRNGAETRPGTAPPPPPQHALAPPHPHCRPSHGDQGPSAQGQGADAERWVCWDLGPAWQPSRWSSSPKQVSR